MLTARLLLLCLVWLPPSLAAAYQCLERMRRLTEVLHRETAFRTLYGLFGVPERAEFSAVRRGYGRILAAERLPDGTRVTDAIRGLVSGGYDLLGRHKEIYDNIVDHPFLTWGPGEVAGPAGDRAPPAQLFGGRAPRAVIFDLDETLYTSDGLVRSYSDRATAYVRDQILCTGDHGSAAALASIFHSIYGITSNGIFSSPRFDYRRFFAFVEDGLDYERLIARDAALSRAVASLHPRKWLLTNATERHMRRVFRAAGIDAAAFDGITHIEFAPDDRKAILCKPDPRYFEKCLGDMKAAGIEPADCSDILFVDDNFKSLSVAKGLGMRTVFINKRSKAPAFLGRVYTEGERAVVVDVEVRCIHELLRELPESWYTMGFEPANIECACWDEAT